MKMYFIAKITALLLCFFVCGTVGEPSSTSTAKPLTTTVTQASERSSAVRTGIHSAPVTSDSGVSLQPSTGLPSSVSAKASVKHSSPVSSPATKPIGPSIPPSSSSSSVSTAHTSSSTGLPAKTSTVNYGVTSGHTVYSPFSSQHTTSQQTRKYDTSVTDNTNSNVSSLSLTSSPGPTSLKTTQARTTSIENNGGTTSAGHNVSEKLTVTEHITSTSKSQSVSAFSTASFSAQSKTIPPKTPTSEPTVSTAETTKIVNPALPNNLMETVINSLFSGGSLQNLNKVFRDMNFLNQLFGRVQNENKTNLGMSDVFQGILSALPELVDDKSAVGEDMRDILEGIGVAPNTTKSLSQFILDIQGLMSPESLLSEDQCIADTSALLNGLGNKEMWAIQMLDAAGKPGKSLLKGALKFWGNFDECMETEGTVVNSETGLSHVIRGEYWQLGFSFPSSLGTSMDIAYLLVGGKLMWDVCLPESCDKEHVMNATAKLPLGLIGMETKEPVRSPHRNWKKDPTAVLAVVFICLVVSLSVIGTLYDVISAELARRHKSDLDNDSVSSIDGGYTSEVTFSDDGRPSITRFSNGFSMVTLGDLKSGAEDDDTPSIVLRELGGGKRKAGLGRQLLLSFSLHKNTEKIMNTTTGESNLGCIHGIRVLSMAWVILGHSLIGILSATENILDYLDRRKDFTMQAMINGTLSVDTFFLISGVLLCYLFLRESKKSVTGKPTVRQMALYYVHRYWRLTPVYMFIILLYTGLDKYLSDGPNDISSGPTHVDSENCRYNWWSNLLYINNLYKPSEMCIAVSWFLADDMQFYVVAPLALLPLAFGWTVVGILVIVLFFVIHIVTYGYLDWSVGGFGPIEIGNDDFMHQIYFTPWCRVGVFALGLLLGFLLYKMKKNTKIPRYVLVLGWQVGLTIGLLCTYVTYADWKDGNQDWTMNTKIVHETLYRPGWAIFVSWIIFVCCRGYGGVVNSILSWSAWIPLGRLTYGAYLIHTIVQEYTRSSARSLVYMNITSMSYEFIGCIVVSYALSFLTCVLVEYPCMGVEKAVLAKFKIKK